MALGFVRGGEVQKDFDRDVMCIYKERDGTAKLRRFPWRFTSEEHVAIMHHIGVCSTSHTRLDCRVVVPTSPGFMWRNEHGKWT